MSRKRIATAVVLGAVLLLPAAARAFHSAAVAPQAKRGLLAYKVDKATVRAPLPGDDRAVALDAALPASGPEIAVVRETNSELTKPAAIRIFLFSTPHNHRAPPAA